MGWLYHLLQTHRPLLDLGGTWSPGKSKEMFVLHRPQSCSGKGKWINLTRMAPRQDAGIEAYSEKLLRSDEILVGVFCFVDDKEEGVWEARTLQLYLPLQVQL